ncbi:hypothetical protein N7520_011428 [Penicillium odoratum]|uniref:uncharacterized protein n=1 Tax=Penicillium odoratum TaxID=1167516 RepID=UPI002547E7F4|nr:uncharacterized protein N7520_011428 [Penicillium odoratum]KAJ5746246.1 hypothetical protein N7520_011428 [Penicillium odoratum]
MSTMTSLERSLSTASSTSLSMSPRLSVGEHTPLGSEPSLINLHDRVNQLDSRVLELRSSLMTKDAYVDRRNREDDHIRREFSNQNATCHRIDLNVIALRTDVDRLQKDVDRIRSDTALISDLQITTNQLSRRIEYLESRSHTLETRFDSMDTRFDDLESRMNSKFDSVNSRIDSLESRMDSRFDSMERIRFNSLALTIHANINPVPIFVDGSLKYPHYFPRTVWRFWCLKKPSRVHRLVELAEFYKIEGYQSWSRMHADMFANDSDSSDASDYEITRAEAVRRFPEAAHQALAAILGLVYYKIRKHVGEGPNAAAMAPRPQKRRQEEVASTSGSSKSKPVKMPRRPSVSDSFMQALIHGTDPPYDEETSVSAQSAILGWQAFSDVSEEARNKLQSMDPNDLNALFRAVEQGRRTLKPSRSEMMNRSPTESKASNNPFRKATEPAREEVAPASGPVPTERATFSSSQKSSRAQSNPVPTSGPNLVPTEPATFSSQSQSRARPAVPSLVPTEPNTAPTPGYHLIPTEPATPSSQGIGKRQTSNDVLPTASDSDSSTTSYSDSSS